MKYIKEGTEFLDQLKDRVHEQQKEIERLKIDYQQAKEILAEQNKEIERLNNIINEQDKELELERKSRQLLTDDLANVCEMSLKKDNIINKAIEYIEQKEVSIFYQELGLQQMNVKKDLLEILGKVGVDKE